MDLTESDKFNLEFEVEADAYDSSSGSIDGKFSKLSVCREGSRDPSKVRHGMTQNNFVEELEEEAGEPKILADQLKDMGFVVEVENLIAPDEMVLTPVESPQRGLDSGNFLPTSPLRKGSITFGNA